MRNNKYRLVSRYFEASRFKEAIQSCLKTHKKGIKKKVVVYINDIHHSDIAYADLLNLIISYQDERSVFREKSFIDRLCKMINHSLGNDNKENARGKKPTEEEIQTNIESQALEYINNNLILIINLNSLHNYYHWVSFYPNLEKLCSTRFINETTKEKETFEGKAVSSLTSQSDIISSCNFIEGFIKEFIQESLTENEDQESHTQKPQVKADERVVFGIKEGPCLKVKPDRRLGTSVSTKLTSDKMQIFKDPE